MIAGGGEVDDVTGEDAVVAAWDDGVVMAFDGRHVKESCHLAQLTQIFAYQWGIFTNLHTNEYQSAVVELKPVARPVVMQGVEDFEGGEIFGIYGVVGTY